MIRTVKEITSKIHEKNKVFSFFPEVLLGFLPFENAKEFLKPEVTVDEWETTPLDRDTVLKEMHKYMEFAWVKAADHRGISASRSVDKFAAWVWLLGDVEVEAGYKSYGAPFLKAVCLRYDFPIPDGEDLQNMMEGELCSPSCKEGCGR